MQTRLYTDNIPVYLDVYNSLYKYIMDGTYPPGEYLTGETALSQKYGVSRNTLRQALAILQEDGMIIKSQGKGTLIAPHSPSSPTNLLEHPPLTQCKLPITDTILSYNYGAPTDIARDKLELTTCDLVLACNCVFHSDQTVLSYSFTQIPATFFDLLLLDTAQEDSIREVILKTLFTHTERMYTTIKLIYVNHMETEFLKVPEQTPALLLESIHYTKENQPLARNKFYVLPEYYQLHFPLYRKSTR